GEEGRAGQAGAGGAEVPQGAAAGAARPAEEDGRGTGRAAGQGRGEEGRAARPGDSAAAPRRESAGEEVTTAHRRYMPPLPEAELRQGRFASDGRSRAV